jgi:YVTN family beta-propeller protein
MVRAIASKIIALGILSGAIGLAPAALAQTVTTTVFSGAAPIAVAVNPATNSIYVANQSANTVTVINGATNNTFSVPVGSSPAAIAVDPVTDQIYVANLGSATVTVIDGPTNNTSTLNLPAGSAPTAVAVDSTTNKIYVADQIAGTGSVTVINGASDTPAVAATVATSIALAGGTEPYALGVNPVTDLIYVATQSGGSGGATIINGATNSVSGTVATGSGSSALAVNPVTNTIYVANQGASSVTVINGATNATATVGVGTNPTAIGVNPVTALAYVANSGGAGSVSVISGTSVTATIAIGTVLSPAAPSALAVDSTSDEIYVANYSNSNGSVSAINGATNAVSAPLATGAGPHALAVNPVTNKVYVADLGTSIVTVIDGATNAAIIGTPAATGTSPFAGVANPTADQVYIANFGSADVSVFNAASTIIATVAVGTNANADPVALAVNPATNRVYVANQGDSDVTMLDATVNPPAATNIPVGNEPAALAANPLTNKIYVANLEDNTVSVINGATNSTTTVPVGTRPVAVAVNPLTDYVYVVNQLSNSVTVLNGASNVASAVTVGTDPMAVAVNPVTNKIYVANNDGTMTVINGTTNSTLSVATGSQSAAIAVNPLTNTIYVVNQGGNNVTVVNGATNNTTSIATGLSPRSIAINLVSNKIYVGNFSGNTVTVIDGATNAVSTIFAQNSPSAVIVNPDTNTVYVPNSGSGDVTIFAEQNTQSVPLTTAIAPLPGNSFIGSIPPPTFNFTTTSAFAPNAPAAQDVFIQVDTWQGPWVAAPLTGNSASGQPASVTSGTHILYAYSGDPQAASANDPGSPLVGNIAAYVFTIIPEGTTTTLTSNAGNPNTAGTAITFTATIAPVQGAEVPSGLVTFADGSTTIGSAFPQGGVATLTTSNLIPGGHSITATYSGDANTGGSVSAALPITVGAQMTTVAITSAPNPGFLGGAVTFTATVAPQVGGTPTGMVSFINSTANPAVTLGQGPLLANGTASFTTSTLALGTYTINASYLGDALDNPSTTTAAPLTQTIGAASFVVSASPSTQTVTVGQSLLYVIGIQPEGNFNTAITFSCDPTGNADGLTLPADTACVFTPPSITPGTSVTTVALAITTVAPPATSSLFAPLSGKPPRYRFEAYGGILSVLAVLCALLYDGLRRRRRGTFARFAMGAALVIAMGAAMASCHSSSSTAADTGTPYGTYLVEVSGVSGTTSSTTNITANINTVASSN